ncbi:Histone-lysine N-methyltransferase PRDM9 [Cyphomyrmex costatus]|uniref:Histone-lysine N-methyltransferase PRDM9 n=1 Tax=Cyphomyrmex costatus TaxID=456900 RepID=A0A195C1K5_9HYME|nr:Histone-lysine N-methyltransferase PRDM9 [Cyphomyrmex costatus]
MLYYDTLHLSRKRLVIVQRNIKRISFVINSRITRGVCHNMLKTFKCLQCDSTFDRASQLDYHHRSLHLGERSQICQICGKGFFRKADLRTHLNIHLGTNFYICEICGRKFSHISNLIRHCRMHTARHKQMIHGISKEVMQQYYNPSISDKSQINSHGLKKNKTIDNNMKNRILETSCIEPKYINQSTTTDSDVKNEVISDQRDIDVDSKACLFETIIYVTSKQFGESNLAENESTSILPQDHYVKVEERLGSTNLSINNTISNSSQDIVNNHEQIPFKDSITYLHQLDKNNSTVLSQDREFNAESKVQNNEYIVKSSNSHICISRGTCKESSLSNVKKSLNMETNFPIYNSNEVLMDQKVLRKQISKGVISENKKCNKSLSDNDNQLYIELSNSGMLKLDEPRHCNNNISLTGLKSCHSENNTANEIIYTSKSAIQNAEENLENFSNANNTVLNNEEPMLHLVQTETGEQFYEFIISSLVEKMQDTPCTKDVEDTIECPPNIFRDSQKVHSNLKGSEKVDQIEHQQALDDLVDINNEFNYTQFDFYREEKNYAILSHDVSEHFKQNVKENECVSNTQKKNQIYNFGNMELLENETHVDFDKYVEINLEAFERLNYENCNEKFLEFVEVADIGTESSGYKELSMVRLIQNDGEQLLELLQDSQAEQEVNQDFIQANNFKDCSNILQNNSKRADCSKNKSNLFTCVEDNVLVEENMNSNKDIKNIKEYIDNSNHTPTDVTTTKSASSKNIRASEESKKSKIISRKFQCLVCKKAFSTTYNYKQHIGIHFTDQQKFHCKNCGVSFAWKSTLNKHIANNHTSDSQKFVCEICPKVYSTLSQVNDHVKRDHLKQRNHVCLHCGKSFFKKYDLKTHSRTHTNERPYVCRVCGKRFHHQSHIIRHERTHSGERPYVCDICQRTFTQPSSLKAHKQKHQQIRMDFLDYQIDEDDPITLTTL